MVTTAVGVHVLWPLLQRSIVYPITWLPPSDVGAVHDSVVVPVPSMDATSPRGAPGAVTGVAVVDANAPVPTDVTAATRNV